MIIIPMAGNSSRFFKAGYTVPKYELPIGKDTLFALTVRSFEAYFASEHFVFICRKDFNAKPFVEAECQKLGIAHYTTVELESTTRGQAETVLLGLQGARYSPFESIVVFNIDTIRPGYLFPALADSGDGYLEVFQGPGENWSFVRPAASFSSLAAETTEKKRISNFCCTGLYHFAKAADFVTICEAALSNIEEFRKRWKELYIAPMYNDLIESHRKIQYVEVPASEVLFSGTPDEYEALLATLP